MCIRDSIGARLPDAPAGLHLWGGETTLSLPVSPGRGGRSQHLALAAATVIAGRDELALLAGATDGSDGPGEDAGGLVDGGTVARGAFDGLDAQACLRRADSGNFLEVAGDLIQTGPTGTNVMDLVLALKWPARVDSVDARPNTPLI
jgi:hydroxypyruvate reductase